MNETTESEVWQLRKVAAELEILYWRRKIDNEKY